MNDKELLEEWEEGESTGVRPERLRVIRDDIYRVTGMMPPRRPSEIESWLDRLKGQVTQKLREEVGRGDTSEDGEDDEEESEDGE